MYVYCSDDGVNPSGQLAVPSETKQDQLNVTRLCSGNDSDFMEMTTCVGGMMGNDTTIAPDSPILSPALEQENNANHGERESRLADAHNKSVFYANDSEDCDLSLTCVGNGVISLESAPSTAVGAGYASATDRGVNNTVLSDGDDMEMTKCLSLNVSTKVGDDMELTQCLPLDISTSIKSTCRWPFGKRQDGTRERISRYEENLTNESSLGNRGPFAEVDDLDVSEKVDTLAFLMELNTMEKPAEMREVHSASSQNQDVPFPTSSACFLPSSFPAAVPSCPDGKSPDMNALSMFVSEHVSESLLNKITDAEDAEVRFKHSQLVIGSSASVVVAVSEPVKSDTSIISSSAVSTNETSASFVMSSVKHREQVSTSFLTKTAPEDDGNQTATCAASSSMLSTTAETCPISDEVALTSSAVSLSVPAVLNQIDGYRCQLEKSLNEQVEHLPEFAEETLKVDDVSASVTGPVRFGADAVESIFAAKDEPVPTISTVAENVSLTVVAAADRTQTAEQVNMSEIRDTGGVANTRVSDTRSSGLQMSTSCNQIVSSQIETEARKPLRNAAQSMFQTADDLLTRVKLANSMPQQIMSKFREDNTATGIRHSFRPTNSAVKQNPAYRPVDKSLSTPLDRHSSTASAFQHYVPELDRTNESGPSVNISEIAGISGSSSRMDISAQHVERTDNLTNSLVSFSITENLDATKREEMHLEPIRNVTLLSSESHLSSSCAGDGVDTSAAKNMELSSSAKPCSQLGSTFMLPVMSVVSESSAFCLASAATTAPNSSANMSQCHLSSSCIGDRVENIETSAASSMELSSSAKPCLQFRSTFTLPAVSVVSESSAYSLPAASTATINSSASMLSQYHHLSSSCAGVGVDNLETSASGNMELSSSAKPCSQFGSTFVLPVTSVASESSAYSLPAASTATTNSSASMLSQHDHIEVITDVKNFTLASQMNTSRAVNVDVEMETSDACHAAERALLAAKSSSEFGDENLSLLDTEASQSSVFCLAGSEAGPTHCTRVQSGDAGSTSMSSNKVRV